jgi:hypothetical protein
MSDSPNYVDGIYSNRITLTITDKILGKKLKIFGSKKILFTKFVYEIKIESEEHKLDILQKLVNVDDLYFWGGGAGWPPAAIVEYYRENGLLSGKIKEITWSGPGKYKMREI